jgi:hypothetical protein
MVVTGVQMGLFSQKEVDGKGTGKTIDAVLVPTRRWQFHWKMAFSL